MGQYFSPVLIRNDKAKYFGSYIYQDGETKYMASKLTEHSWVGNYFVEGLCQDLMKNGSASVAWVGDYAELPKEYASKNPWKRDRNRAVKYEEPKDKENLLDDMYIVNNSKKEFIDFNSYWKKNKEEYVYDGKTYFEAFHPLPLLTAVGNGEGGGDYYGVNIDLIGSWAFDEISIEKEAPTDYTEICPYFNESE